MGKRKKSGSGGGGGGHDGGGGMRWLLTYSDLVTLLVAFFVVMYASSQTDVKKFQAVAGAFQSAFNTGGGGKSVISDSPGTGVIQPPNPTGDYSKLDEVTKETLAKERLAEKKQVQQEQKDFNNVKKQIEKNSQEQGIASSVYMVIDERGLVISIQDTIFFETGKADLLPGARVVLDKLAIAIKNLPNKVRIEGHTDNVPIHTVEYPNNWRLSTDRAVRVLMYLQTNHGYTPEKLSAAGYGEYHPVADNNSDAGKARNRRVDIVILRSEVNQNQIIQ